MLERRWSGMGADRRRLIGRGAALVAGAIGVGIASGRAGPTLSAAGAASQASGVPGYVREELRLYGRNWRARGDGGLVRLVRPEPGDRQLVVGEVASRPGAEGPKVGEFYATCTCANAPFGAGPLAASFVEHHTLNLLDGTISGMGTSLGEESVFAIVGGTGRYAGARGSYVARQSPHERGGDGTAALVLTLDLPA